MYRKLGVIALTIAVLILTGCSREENDILVYSDLPETVELVNLFNQTQTLYKASFVYAASEEEVLNPNLNDIILSRSLQSYKERMLSLDSYRNTDFVKSIYPEILKSGIQDTTLKTIPLSLDIPVVIAADLPGDSKFYSWEEISSHSGVFNKVVDGSLTQCGFSPLWSDSFLTAYFYSGISSFADDMETNNLDDMKNIVNELVSWISNVNGSLELDQNFNEKYRYIPDYRLIKNGRIGFMVSSLSEWTMLPDKISRDLEAKTLTLAGGVQSTAILSAGIPVTASNPEGARAFLSWLLTEKTWDDYLRLTGRNRDDSFAFLGGISSSERINRNILVEYYPALGEFIPLKGEMIRFPGILPQWTVLWDDFLLPRIKESIRNPQVVRDIAGQYKKWILLHPDLWNS